MMLNDNKCLVCGNTVPENAEQCPVCGFPVISTLHGTEEENRILRERAEEYRAKIWAPELARREQEERQRRLAETGGTAVSEEQKKLEEEHRRLQMERQKLEEARRKLEEEELRNRNAGKTAEKSKKKAGKGLLTTAVIIAAAMLAGMVISSINSQNAEKNDPVQNAKAVGTSLFAAETEEMKESFAEQEENETASAAEENVPMTQEERCAQFVSSIFDQGIRCSVNYGSMTEDEINDCLEQFKGFLYAVDRTDSKYDIHPHTGDCGLSVETDGTCIRTHLKVYNADSAVSAQESGFLQEMSPFAYLPDFVRIGDNIFDVLNDALCENGEKIEPGFGFNGTDADGIRCYISLDKYEYVISNWYYGVHICYGITEKISIYCDEDGNVIYIGCKMGKERGPILPPEDPYPEIGSRIESLQEYTDADIVWTDPDGNPIDPLFSCVAPRLVRHDDSYFMQMQLLKPEGNIGDKVYFDPEVVIDSKLNVYQPVVFADNDPDFSRSDSGFVTMAVSEERLRLVDFLISDITLSGYVTDAGFNEKHEFSITILPKEFENRIVYEYQPAESDELVYNDGDNRLYVRDVYYLYDEETGEKEVYVDALLDAHTGYEMFFGSLRMSDSHPVMYEFFDTCLHSAIVSDSEIITEGDTDYILTTLQMQKDGQAERQRIPLKLRIRH